MSDSSIWIAAQGGDLDDVLAALELRRTGAHADEDDDDLFALSLPGGWHVILDRTMGILDASRGPDRLTRFSHAVKCGHSDDPMVAFVSVHERGREIWSASLNAETEGLPLRCTGPAPDALSALEARLGTSLDKEERGEALASAHDEIVAEAARLTGFQEAVSLPAGTIAYEIFGARATDQRLTPAEFKELLERRVGEVLLPTGFRRVRSLDYVKARGDGFWEVVSLIVTCTSPGIAAVTVSLQLYSDQVGAFRGAAGKPGKRRRSLPDDDSLIEIVRVPKEAAPGAQRDRHWTKEPDKIWQVPMDQTCKPQLDLLAETLRMTALPWLSALAGVEDLVRHFDRDPLGNTPGMDTRPVELLAAHGFLQEARTRLRACRSCTLARPIDDSSAPAAGTVRSWIRDARLREIELLTKRLSGEERAKPEN